MSNRALLFLSLIVLLFAAPLAQAQTPLGGVAATFPYTASRLLADPARNRVYAAIPDSEVFRRMPFIEFTGSIWSRSVTERNHSFYG